MNKLLVGNKCDLTTRRQVDYEVAKTYADKMGIPFIETSAKQSTNVEKAFLAMATEVKNTFGANTASKPDPLDKRVEIHSQNIASRDGGCC